MSNDRPQRDETSRSSRGASRPRDAPRLLIVERNPSTRESMGLVLKRHYRIQTAASYEQGVRRLRTTPIDGIFVSIDLRDGEAGIEMVRDVRSMENHAAVPIILILDPSLEEVRERLGEAGADAFLRRPFVRSELVETLQRHVENERKGGGKTGS